MSNPKKKADELFRYETLVDSISSEEEIGFDAFLNRGNDNNNKRKSSFSKKEGIELNLNIYLKITESRESK